MRLILSFLLLPLLILAGIESSQAVGQPDTFGSRWIVELEEAPTLEFAGQGAALEQGAGSNLPMFAATAPAVTGREFDALDPEVMAYEAFLQQRQRAFLDNAQFVLGHKLGKAGSTRHVANTVILEDISVAEAQRLAELPGVRSIERESLYRLQLSDGPALIGARALAEGVAQLPPARGEGTVVGIIDSGINWNHRAFSANPTYSGGYEYSNPFAEFLGLCDRANVPCNDKLVGVYDFTDSSTDGEDTDGHGTHVAAIAAGNEWQADLGGVAPRAHIISYRVCTEQDPDDDESGTCQGSAILQALDQAVRDGVDVVNYSIGADAFDPWRDGPARRVLNLLDAGVAFATSAGNSGPDPETVGSPAEAPWVFAVGSSTHRERSGRQVRISGVGTWFILYGTGPDLPVPSFSDVPLRAGDAVSDSLEGCEAFPANAFDGAVALLKRGDCFFADKVDNAAAAGAVAVIMVNNVAGGPILMGGLQDSTIPAGMVSLSDGEEILLALSAAGGELPVSLPTATVTVRSDSLGDQVSGFSSRGPVKNASNVMKPNVVAPGDGILAAYIPNSTSTERVSGTSMASPHAVGSMALLRQLEPDWTPTMLYSALETTAETETVLAFGEPADIFDRGAGRIRVDLAARAGLYLPVTRSEFQSANPDFGGDPGELNLAGLINENCGSSCTFVRTVRAMRAGDWAVSAEGEVEISVTPTEFSLAPGESQELTITVTPTGDGSDALQQGAVVLTPPSLTPPPPEGNLVTQRLPIGVRSNTGEVNLPERVRIDAEGRQGHSSVDLGFVDDLPEATFPTSTLSRPRVEEFSLPEDADPFDPYDGDDGTRFFLLEVPEDSMAIWAEITASSAPDIDLFVGRDANRDGLPQAGEQHCESVSPAELERCIIASPSPGTWWILVQNWEGSSSQQDAIELQLAVLAESEDQSLIAFGPGRHEAGLLELDLYWDRADLKHEQRMLGAVGISSSADRAIDVGVVPVEVRLNRLETPRTRILFPGETVPIAVPAGGRHDRLVFDVPPTARSLRVDVQGESGISGSLRRVPFSAIRETAPATPPPSGPVLASGSNSEAGFNLSQSSALEPGRYFVQLENAADTDRVVEVTVSVEQDSGLLPRFGLWSPVGAVDNPRQEISQGFEWQRGSTGSFLWYTYDNAGLPIFYLGTGDFDLDSSLWITEIDRYTRSEGDQRADLAGSVAITMIDSEQLVFSWRGIGGHGSDIMENKDAPTCPRVDGQPVSYTGTWFTPGEDQGGSSAVVTGNAQGHVRYYFDDNGNGRWVLATDGGGAPLIEELELLEFRGFCPNCEFSEVTREVVGTYFRSYESEDSGVEALDFISRPPLDELVEIEVPIVKLSTRLDCS